MVSEHDSTAEHAQRERVVWRVVDGKPGHESQTRGLADALARRVPLRCYDLRAPAGPSALLRWALGRMDRTANLPSPDWILGAGRRTHLPLLLARRARGGRAIVLMRPGPPQRCFDLCLVPRHDKPNPAENVLETVGVLNPVRPASKAAPDKGLVLLGGPSAHYRWDRDGVLRQVQAVVRGAPRVAWTLTTSRRTPPGVIEALARFDLPNLNLVPCDETPPGWVPARLDECRTVWVTEDSVSMIHEALTAGAGVGLLGLPPARGTTRVVRAVRALVVEERAVPFSAASPSFTPEPRHPPLAEADRCAEAILARFDSP